VIALCGQAPEVNGVQCSWERYADIKSPCVLGRDAPGLLRNPPYLCCLLGALFDCVGLLCLPIEILVKEYSKVSGANDQFYCSLWEL